MEGEEGEMNGGGSARQVDEGEKVLEEVDGQEGKR